MKVSEQIKNVLAMLLLNIAWLILISFFFKWLYGTSNWDDITDMRKHVVSQLEGITPQAVFFYSCISAPIWEEIVYRHAPISLLRVVDPERKAWIPVILAISIIFGYSHGNLHNIYIQGMFGLSSAILYIKNKYSYWSSVSLHFLWNFFLIYGINIIIK